MDRREISARLYDILGTAHRVRQPGPGRPVADGIESIDAVKAGLRALITDLGEQEPQRHPLRRRTTASAFPEGRIFGTRATVQHRRRVHGAAVPARPSPRAAADAAFARLTAEPENVAVPL